MPPRRTTRTNSPPAAQLAGNTNTAHLVLSTADPHPPFIQEVPGQPGEVERCVWDDTINGYRCTIIGEDSNQ